MSSREAFPPTRRELVLMRADRHRGPSVITRTDARRLKYLGVKHRSIVAPKGFGANPRGRHQLNEFVELDPLGGFTPARGAAVSVNVASLLAMLSGMRRHRRRALAA